MFETLYQAFKGMNVEQDRRLHFHGSFGAGCTLVAIQSSGDGFMNVFLIVCQQWVGKPPNSSWQQGLSMAKRGHTWNQRCLVDKLGNGGRGSGRCHGEGPWTGTGTGTCAWQA